MSKAGLTVILLGVAALLFGVLDRQKDPFNAEVLIAHPSASEEWAGIATAALERVTIGTRFDDRWQVGRKPSEGYVSLVLIDSERLDQASLTPALARNCTFTGSQDLIICDVALVRKFLSDRDLDKRSVSTYDADGHVVGSQLKRLDPASLKRTYQLMLEWILGHEIGHILNGDRRTHFTSARLEDPVSPRTIDQERELNADAFLARQYEDDDGADLEFYLFLVDILQREINRKACPDRSPGQGCPNIQVGVLIFSPNDYIRYSAKGTHPEFIIRMDRLLVLADEQHDLGIIGPLARGLKQKLLEDEAPAPKLPA